MKYVPLIVILVLALGCSIKSGKNQYDFMQAQVKKGHTTIETESGVGGRVETIGGSGPIDIWLGLVKRTYTMIPPMECVEFYENNTMVRKVCNTLPSLDVDTSVTMNPIKPEVSDTVTTGNAAENLREATVGGETK